MFKLIISNLIVFSLCSLVSASDDAWSVFWDEDYHLRGFKDSQGNVQIEPRFWGSMQAYRFRNIIAVMDAMEKIDGKYITYYLLKDGTRVAIGDMYVYDNMFDCESENKIRFRSRATDKVGFLDGSGKIVIPAIYSDATRFTNGIASVIKDAKRFCFDGTERTGTNRCEHWEWKNGKEYVVDTENNMLIGNVRLSRELNLFSMIVTDTKPTSTVRESFKGMDEKYYSFINYKNEFEEWLYKVFLPDLDHQSLKSNSYHEFSQWQDGRKWFRINKDSFLSKNSKVIVNELKKLLNPENKRIVKIESLNGEIYSGSSYAKYFDDCNQGDAAKYPVLSLITKHNEMSDYKQNFYSFLRTDEGYKLISITLRSNSLEY